MSKILLLLLLGTATACQFNATSASTAMAPDPNTKQKITGVLENWHKAAAEADFETYFELMSEDGIFIGTDATENWQNAAFRDFAKPYFDNGKAWNFTTLERNIYPSETGKTAWFDELLNTQMGICRGSGVLEYEEGNWKIKHYVLSVTVPNEDINEVVAAKKERDSILISKLN